MEIQAGRIFAKEFGLHSLTGKKFLMTCVIAVEFWELCNEGCEASVEFGGMFYHPLCAGRTSDTDLEISAMRHWFSFAWTQVTQVLNQ